MINRFEVDKAKNLDDLEMRVYTSRLLGVDQNLVLHGGGNTSVKIDGILYVKGSGWNLDTIRKKGFSPAKIDSLLKLLENEHLSDSDMVKLQKQALIKDAPNPSIEAILHALIPYKTVDHTHADAVVTISNSIDGEAKIREVFKDFLIIPYVMPGFVLAKKVYEMSKGVEWDKLKGIILLNHGIFTFSDDAKESYDKMIESVTMAEEYLDKNAKIEIEVGKLSSHITENVKTIKQLMEYYKYNVYIKINDSEIAKQFASMDDLSLVQKGVLTPEHIIRTKRVPIIFDIYLKIDMDEYIKEYENYFNRYKSDETMLNPMPKWAILKGNCVLSFGKDEKEAKIIEDINNHTMEAMLRGEKLGGYQSISEKDSFEMEYWELEQMKLKDKK